MRKIKFRGKHIGGGVWVYGDYHHREGGVHCIIDMQPDPLGKVAYVLIQVDADTVGQFTGIYDKTGREIYEGDIVAIAGVIKGYVRYNARYWRYEIATADEPLENERIPSGRPEECWMVIGNIHDSPELLKTE